MIGDIIKKLSIQIMKQICIMNTREQKVIVFGNNKQLWKCMTHPPCPIRSDRQTTSLTLTTGVCGACTKRRGCEQHEYSLWRHRFTDCCVEVTLRSDCLACMSWPGKRGVLISLSIAHIRDIQESAGSRQLDGWRWIHQIIVIYNPFSAGTDSDPAA